MTTFRQKTRLVDAVQFTLRPDNVEVVGVFCDGAARWLAHSDCMELDTEFCRWYIYDNDWVIRYWDGHDHHYWVMKPEAFKASYEVRQ